MNYKKVKDKIFISISKGELINEKLLEVAIEENLTSAWINGLGALTNIEIAYYDIKQKIYIKKKFNSHYELLSLIGNISLVENKPFVHTHITFSNTNYKVFGGHLFDAEITAAGEFFISISQYKLHRTFNCDIGLALWDIK